MSSDMLTSMLASDVESESRTWKDRQDEIEQEFIETCHWRYIVTNNTMHHATRS